MLELSNSLLKSFSVLGNWAVSLDLLFTYAGSYVSEENDATQERVERASDAHVSYANWGCGKSIIIETLILLKSG